MKSKTIVKEVVEKQESITYPALLKSSTTGLIILFTHYGIGTVVGNPSKFCNLGYHSDIWIMDVFKKTDDSVLLEP